MKKEVRDIRNAVKPENRSAMALGSLAFAVVSRVSVFKKVSLNSEGINRGQQSSKNDCSRHPAFGVTPHSPQGEYESKLGNHSIA